MFNPDYNNRLTDKYIESCLEVAGAVCIEGPKWCGKTWTSEHHSNSSIYIGDPEGNYQNKTLATLDPLSVLAGDTPRLIDEWQEVPPLWDAVRNEVDRRKEKGQFILTGSATPNKKGKMHSGAGRIIKIRMRPMSLFESGDSSGQISLEKICNGDFTNVVTGPVQLEDLIYLTVRGGWPGNIKSDRQKAGILPKSYIKAVLDEDIDRVEGKKRDKKKMEKLLKSLARNESTTVTNNTLKKDIEDTDGSLLDVGTISEYLEVFEKIFLLDDQLPFSSNIRSSVRVKQQSKRHLADPSLACALLNITAKGLLGDLNTFGFLFEALCERDLRIYAESFGGNLYHYQDYQNREIDAVIEMPDGEWAAVEIKLGAAQADEGAANLLKIDKEIRRDSGGRPPKALIVVCGMTNAAYRRDDGVYIVPITALRN